MKKLASYFLVLVVPLLETRAVGAFVPLLPTVRQNPTKTPAAVLHYRWSNAEDDVQDKTKTADPSSLTSLTSSDTTTSSSNSSPLTQLVSSPIGALLVLACVVLVHESGHYLAARAFGVHADEFSVGIGPKLFGFHEFSLRALPIGGYVKLPELLQYRPWQQRMVISSAGVVFNFLLALLVSMNQIIFGPGLVKPVFDPGVLVEAVMDKAAAKGILRQGDVILSVNGVPLTTAQSGTDALKQINNIIVSVQATPDGESIHFSVKRPNTRNLLNINVKPKRMTASEESPGDEPGPPTIGVYLEPNVVGVDHVKTDSALEAARFATEHILQLAKETATGFLTFSSDVVSGKGKSSDYRVTGPVGVLKRASKVVATQDVDTVLNYVAAISINLGVLNLVPVPPSDGFQILFILLQTLLGQRTRS